MHAQPAWPAFDESGPENTANTGAAILRLRKLMSQRKSRMLQRKNMSYSSQAYRQENDHERAATAADQRSFVPPPTKKGPPAMPGHILIVDDHPMVRGALRDVVSVLTPDTPILTAGTLAEAMENLEDEPQIEFVTLDLRLPDTHGLTGVIDLHARYPKKKLLVTSAHDDPDLVRLTLLLGAAGFLSKSCSTDVIKSAIADFIRPRHRDDDADGADKRMFADGYFLPSKDLEALTPQQSRVLRHLCEGHMNKIIAFEMGVSETTVKAHVSEILRKFGMRTRTLAILRVINPF